LAIFEFSADMAPSWSIGAIITATSLLPERVRQRLASLDEAAEGFKLYPALEPVPSGMQVKKIKYSAFIQGPSDIDAQFKSRGIDTVLIASTATNVCCE
jgi:ureidoacrylate peracid hydrolase